MLVLIASDDLTLSVHEAEGLAVDGELVVPVVVPCANPQCETCPSAWYGLMTHRPIETAMVVDRPGVTEADLRRLVRQLLTCQGAVDDIVEAVANGEYSVDGELRRSWVVVVEALVDDHLRELEVICSTYDVGTVVSRLGSLVCECDLSDAA